MYRPQFAYPTPPGARDVPYEYFFDSSTQPAVSIPVLSSYFAILFQLDKDAEFRWRGTKVGLQAVSNPLQVMWKDPNGRLLSDVVTNTSGDLPFLDTTLYAQGSGFGIGFGGLAVPWDEEIVCPPGAVIESNWFNPSGSTAVTVPSIVTLLGVKRYYEGKS